MSMVTDYLRRAYKASPDDDTPIFHELLAEVAASTAKKTEEEL
jgi:hypothetical protein